MIIVIPIEFLKSALNRLLTSRDVYLSQEKFTKQQSLNIIVQAR